MLPEFRGFSCWIKLLFLWTLIENRPMDAVCLSLSDGSAPRRIDHFCSSVIAKAFKKLICKLNVPAVRKYQGELLIGEGENTVSTVDSIIDDLHVFHANAYLCGNMFVFVPSGF